MGLRKTVFQNAHQKTGLGDKRFGRESSHFTDFLQRAEEYMRGDILFTGIGEQIVGNSMPAIGARCSVNAFGAPEFLVGEEIINGAELACAKRTGGRFPSLDIDARTCSYRGRR